MSPPPLTLLKTMPQAAGKKGARLVWQPLKILEHFKIRSPTVASIQGIAGKGRSREEYHICFLSWRNLALCYKKILPFNRTVTQRMEGAWP